MDPGALVDLLAGEDASQLELASLSNVVGPSGAGLAWAAVPQA
jgi:hypothetical protein